MHTVVTARFRPGWAAALLVVAGLSACAASRGERGGDDSAAQAGSGAMDGASRGPFVLGCRREPLVLGQVPDQELIAPQVVWTGDDFVVGWSAGDGYRITVTNGQSISNQRTLDAPPSAPSPLTPQLFWVHGRLELYYPLSDAIFADAFDPALELLETRMIGHGSFRAVQLDDDRVAVLADSAVYLDGAEITKPYSHVGALGWNGEYLLVSQVLGHGAWTLAAFELDGTRHIEIDERFPRQWCGSCGTAGLQGGSSFASSPDAHRHALIIAADHELTVAVEGRAPLVRELAPGDASAPPLIADAALLWDGKRYVALLADRAADGGADRDLTLIPVTLDGEDALAEHPALSVSTDAADDRFPAIAAAGPGDYAIAWVRGQELVVQRCALSQR